MDKKTKELYETVVKNLSGRTIISSSPARLSFAVSNLFKAIKEKYHQNVEKLKVLGGKVADKIVNIGVDINAAFQNLVQNNESKRDFINNFGETDKVQEAIDTKVDNQYGKTLASKEELLASIQHDNRLVNAGAGFVIDVQQADVEALKNRIINEKTKPHRLLVNKMFLNQFKDAAMAKRIRLRERKNLKLAVAKEVRKFDAISLEIRKRYADDPAMIMTNIEQEKANLSPGALDFVMLRESMGYRVTPKEVWKATFIGLDEIFMDRELEKGEETLIVPEQPVVPEIPVEQLALEATPTVNPEQVEVTVEQPTTPVVEEVVVETPVVPEQPVVPAEEQVAENPTEVPVAQPAPEVVPVEQNLNRDELNQSLINVLKNVEQKALETPAGQVVTPTEVAPVATPEQVEATVEQPTTPVVEEVVVETPVVPEQPVAEAQVVPQPTREPNEQETLLGGIDTLRAGYREELNDGYNYTETQKKEWEDARLAEELVSKDSNLSYDDQEANVLSYEQRLQKQREVIVEIDNQLAVMKAAEQRIAELFKEISPDLLKQVKADAAPQVAPQAIVVEPEGRQL